MWKHFISDYLTFTKKDRRGTIVILILILLFITVPFLFPFFIKQKTYDHSKFEKFSEQQKFDIITSNIPKFSLEKVFMPRFGMETCPWSVWTNPTGNPIWWTDYNLVKHRRNSEFGNLIGISSVLCMPGFVISFMVRFPSIMLL